MHTKHFLNGLATGCFLMLPAAFGQNPRSWVSSTGSDLNLCTRSSPCATFAGALANTSSGGEIDVVDPGDYGPVNINQPVTIDGGGMGRIYSATNTIVISASNVTVRNLTLLGGGPTAYKNWGFLIYGSAGNVTIGNVQISNFVLGVNSQTTGGQVTIVDSTILQGSGGVLAENPVVIRNSTISGFTTYGVGPQNGGTATLDGVLITNCGTGIYGGGTVLLRNSTITGNTTGLTGGPIVSFVNNAIYNNGTDGSPTKSIFQK